MAHGLLAHVAFLDPEVVEYALQIPFKYKLRDGVSKWILRMAMEDVLPGSILDRPKAKFWEGAGVEDLLSSSAEERVSDTDFANSVSCPTEGV
jgi:asparagine synthase (glutamine-hydrolysing)